eukprot:TRINITY_DN21966_c0_g1_i1.p1 TRINITY_DN21966_c0_g1~~TRINITY_DN21966_c0_g1_i1.p1  ORF type:complete len:805 (-),score=104.50 TRINITY_DN21966_c0_g1_i1:17-2431(-)
MRHYHRIAGGRYALLLLLCICTLHDAQVQSHVHLDAPALSRLLLNEATLPGDGLSARTYAADKILSQDLHELAVREVFEFADWDAARRFVRTLVPTGTSEGVVLSLMSWLRKVTFPREARTVADGLNFAERTSLSTPSCSPRGSGGSTLDGPCFQQSDISESSGRALSSAVSEAAAAAAVAGRPRSEREKKLREFLFQDYDMETHPSNNVVQIGINFFKITELDLRSSILRLPVWFRLQWVDSRLKYNASLWGVNQLFVHADSNSLEDTKVWVPDIEMYNTEEGIGTSLAWKQAALYPDGSLFWSRPGVIKPLCKFKGLGRFPLDELACVIEFGAWALDKGAQDLVLRTVDGGYTFSGKDEDDAKVKSTSETSGSTYQIYTIKSVSAKRKEVFYDCCIHPFVNILYTVQIQRGAAFYVMKLIVPQIAMAALSVITYFMDAAIGERLGFGITLVLAVIATDIVATDFMPVCDEVLLMNYVNWSSLLFCIIALFESGVVLSIYYLELLDFQQVLPRCLRRKSFRTKDTQLGEMLAGMTSALRRLSSENPILRRMSTGGVSVVPQEQATDGSEPPPLGFGVAVSEPASPLYDAKSPFYADPLSPRARSASEDGVIPFPPSPLSSCRPPPSSSGEGDAVRDRSTSNVTLQTFRKALEKNGAGHRQGIRLRTQLYREAFYILDDDFSGKLEKKEVDDFGRYMLADDWTPDLLDEFMRHADLDHSGGLSFAEFCRFCEGSILSTDESKEVEYVSEMVKGFMSLTSTRREMVKQKWQSIANSIDKVFRVLIPSCMLVTYVLLFSLLPLQND